MPIASLVRPLFVSLTAFAAASLLGGCLAHKTIEPIEGATPVADNPNDPPVPEAIATAMRWVVVRYQPAGEDRLGRAPEQQFAINLPIGTRRDVCDRICRLTAKTAEPLREDNQALPTYHIGRVWIRGDTATVDVFAPVAGFTPPTGATGPSATMVYQCITLVLRTRGLEPYYIQSSKVWAIGSFETPPLHLLATEGSDQRVGGMTTLQLRRAKAATSAPVDLAPPPPPASPAPDAQPQGGVGTDGTVMMRTPVGE